MIKRIIAKSGIEHNCAGVDTIMNVHVVYCEGKWYLVSHEYGNHGPSETLITICPFCNQALKEVV